MLVQSIRPNCIFTILSRHHRGPDYGNSIFSHTHTHMKKGSTSARPIYRSVMYQPSDSNILMMILRVSSLGQILHCMTSCRSTWQLHIPHIYPTDCILVTTAPGHQPISSDTAESGMGYTSWQ